MSKPSRLMGLELVLVRQFNGVSDPGPVLHLPWDGRVTVEQYTLLVDEINLIGIITVDLLRKQSEVVRSEIGVLFQVDSNEILYVRECEDLELLSNTYQQVISNEMSNNQVHFVLEGTIKLVQYTQALWGRRLGYIPS